MDPLPAQALNGALAELQMWHPISPYLPQATHEASPSALSLFLKCCLRRQHLLQFGKAAFVSSQLRMKKKSWSQVLGLQSTQQGHWAPQEEVGSLQSIPQALA